MLSYLNAIEKLNCVYCGYGNGVIAYGREIIARTEQFWCPIKHASKAAGEHDCLLCEKIGTIVPLSNKLNAYIPARPKWNAANK